MFQDGQPPQCTAVVKYGICIWIDALRNLTRDAANMTTIHVAPGQIIYKERTYASIWDSSNAARELSHGLPPIEFGDTPKSYLSKEPDQVYDKLQILAEERADSASIKLVYKLSSKSLQRSLQPGVMTEEILAATARVPCLHTAACSDTNLVIACWQRKAGWDFDYGHQKTHKRHMEAPSTGFIHHASSPLSKLLAIEGCRILPFYNMGNFNSSLVIRSEQCMACMTRYIATFENEAKWDDLLYRKRRGHCIREYRTVIHII